MRHALFHLYRPRDIMEEGSRKQHHHVSIFFLPDNLTKVHNPQNMIKPV
jgi:hypothetical protein